MRLQPLRPRLAPDDRRRARPRCRGCSRPEQKEKWPAFRPHSRSARTCGRRRSSAHPPRRHRTASASRTRGCGVTRRDLSFSDFSTNLPDPLEIRFRAPQEGSARDNRQTSAKTSAFFRRIIARKYFRNHPRYRETRAGGGDRTHTSLRIPDFESVLSHWRAPISLMFRYFLASASISARIRPEKPQNPGCRMFTDVRGRSLMSGSPENRRFPGYQHRARRGKTRWRAF